MTTGRAWMQVAAIAAGVALIASAPLIARAPLTPQSSSSPVSAAPSALAVEPGRPGLTLRWSRPLGPGTPVLVQPGVVNGLVVLGGADHQLHALRQDSGEPAWNVLLDEIGTARSPVPVGDRLLVSTPGLLTAHSADTGAALWSTSVAGVGTAPTVSDGIAYVASERLQAISVDTGALVWSAELGIGTSTSEPAIDHNTGLVAVGTADGRVQAFDLREGAPRWTYRTGGRVTASPLFADDKILIGDEDGTFYALDAATGEATWTRTLSSPAGGFITPATAAGGIVYAQAGDGTLSALDTSTGEARWQTPTNGGYSAPVLAAGWLYVGGTDEKGQGLLLQIDPVNGQVGAQLVVDNQIRGTATVTDTTVYLPTTSSLVAVNLS